MRTERNMILLRRTFVIMLVGALISTLFNIPSVQAKDEKEILSADEARASIARMGTGKDARVEVRLRDGSKLKGYISAAAEDSFNIRDSKTGATTTIAYAEVSKASRQGGGLSTMTKVIIGAAIVAGAIIGWQVAKPALCDGGAQSRGPC